MPAVGGVDGGGVVDEVFEGVEEGGEADDLWWMVISDVCVYRGEGGREIDTYVDGSREGNWGRGVERLEWVFVTHYKVKVYRFLYWFSFM